MHFIQLLQNRIPNRSSRVTMLAVLILMLLTSACGAHTDANHPIANNNHEQHPGEQMPDPAALEIDDRTSDGNNAKDEEESPHPDAAADGSEDPSEAHDVTDQEPADSGDDEQNAGANLNAIRDQYDMTDPESIAVLVNKTYGLSESYEPNDLVKVEIPFVYQDESVHSLRQVAADAIIDMFEASKGDGIELAGVSGYRSHAIQRILYEKYVARDGEEAANKYSAKPGHSEHSTGLAMDVAGISGQCAANNCFAGTEEALWLADHAHEFGFIIRYPLGKEEITGYQYEPWHLRYVGLELARILYENDWTMEEFFLDLNEDKANPA